MKSNIIQNFIYKINLKLKYLLKMLIDFLVEIFEYLIHEIENYIYNRQLTLKQKILNRLYGFLFALVQHISVYVLLPFTVVSNFYMTIILATIGLLIETSLIPQLKIKDKRIFYEFFILGQK
ncbi:putative integral membrane protein (apicoplast) [Babesia bovis T2Bo]|uniref:Uncharacterized protein n=1 Tax=Babesia bovis TaxID=5865 RepID=A7AXF5_BABBO|nr:putative integral membrane protein [Babesia bovis T2Bo]EDO05078.1 putative integral membrane protein [Babesia bovis T2Bo]|eukprot:YP_002290858.1 hypothetical protein BBOV_V000280 (apicoplast) [Babesia bovis T2Bo]